MKRIAENLLQTLISRFSRSAGSLRTQLIFWNVVAVSLLLGCLGIACRYITLTFIMQSVDRELVHGVAMYMRPPPARRGPFSDGGAAGQHNEPGPFPGPRYDGRDSGPSPFDPARHGRPGGHAGGPPPEPPDPSNPYRPRLFAADGGPARPGTNDSAWDPAALTRALHGETVRTTIRVGGEPVRIFSAPAYTPQRGRGAVQNAFPLKSVDIVIAGVDAGLLLLVPIGLLGAGWVGAALTNRVLLSVHSMAIAAENIGAEDLSQRLPAGGNDEFSELADTFNSLLGRLDRAFREQNRLLDLQRRFTADASHELKTPLTIIKGTASFALSSGSTDPGSRQTFREIDCAADAMSRLVQDLLLLARADEGQMGRDAIDILLRDLLETARERAVIKGSPCISIAIDPEDLVVSGNESELVRLFSNLLDNAVHYTPADGNVAVTALRRGERVVVTVADTGTGIAAEHLPHLGERFYRADSSRTRPTGGTGLGLSICRSIAEAHDGSVSIESKCGAGTRVTVLLPHRQS